MAGEWLDVETAARYLGVKPEVIHRAIHEGRVIAEGRPPRMHRQGLEAALEPYRIRPGELAHLDPNAARRPPPDQRTAAHQQGHTESSVRAAPGVRLRDDGSDPGWPRPREVRHGGRFPMNSGRRGRPWWRDTDVLLAREPYARKITYDRTVPLGGRPVRWPAWPQPNRRHLRPCHRQEERASRTSVPLGVPPSV